MTTGVETRYPDFLRSIVDLERRLRSIELGRLPIGARLLSDNSMMIPGDGISIGPDYSPVLQDPLYLGPPGAITVTPGAGPNNVWLDISWVASTDAQVLQYEIMITQVSTSVSQVQVTGGTSVRFEQLLPNTGYNVQVRSLNKLNQYSAWVQYATNPVSTGKDTVPPAGPTGVVITVGVRSAVITWSDNTETDVNFGAGQYELYIAEDSGFTVGVQTVKVGGSIAVVSNLKTNTTYYAKVRAIDLSGNVGAFSSTVSSDVAAGAASATGPQGVAADWPSATVRLDGEDGKYPGNAYNWSGALGAVALDNFARPGSVGARSVRITNTSGAAVDNGFYVTVTLKKGRYKLTAWMYADGTGVTPRAYINGGVVATGSGYVDQANLPATTWVQRTWAFTVVSESAVEWHFAEAVIPNGRAVWWDDITLENLDQVQIPAGAIDRLNIAALAVDSARIADLAVGTAKIADLAVTDAKINTLQVNKLTAGSLLVAAAVGSGGSIRVGTNPGVSQGIIIDTAGINLYNAAGTVMVQLDAASGGGYFRGTVNLGTVQASTIQTSNFYSTSSGTATRLQIESSVPDRIKMYHGDTGGAYQTLEASIWGTYTVSGAHHYPRLLLTSGENGSGNGFCGLELTGGAHDGAEAAVARLYTTDKVNGRIILDCQGMTYTLQIRPSLDGNSHVQMQVGGYASLKGLNSGVVELQVRDANDSAYAAIRASSFPVGSKLEFKKNVRRRAAGALDLVRSVPVRTYDLRESAHGVRFTGLVYEEAPEELRHGEDGLEMVSMIGTLWAAVQELATRVDRLAAA